MTVNDTAMQHQKIVQKPSRDCCFSSKKPETLSRMETGEHSKVVNQKYHIWLSLLIFITKGKLAFATLSIGYDNFVLNKVIDKISDLVGHLAKLLPCLEPV